MISVPNKESNSRVSKSADFEIGDMVWGKVKSHPWWPGYILDESIALPSVFENKVDGFILVAFFGDGSYGWLDSSDLIPYASNFREKSKQSTMKSFVRAVNESVDEFSRRAALGISCRCRNSDNFRTWNVEDYYLVDVAGYEPNGVYDRRQIETARSDFKSKNIIDFLKNLATATGEVVDNDMDMESVKNLARLKSLRELIFLEKDPTLEEAFELVGRKQAVEKDGTSAKKDLDLFHRTDAAKKGVDLKKRDSFLKRSTQLHSTFKGTSSSSPSPKQPKLLEDSNTPAKHKIEHTDDQLEAKAKKIKRQSISTSPPCINLTTALPDLLSLAKDQFYGDEYKIHVTIRNLFLKYRNQTFLNIFDKAGSDQNLKSHSKLASKSSTTSSSSDEDSKTLFELTSRPPITAAAIKSKPVPKPSSEPSTIAVDQGLKIRSKPATTDAGQHLETQSVPALKRHTSAGDQDLKAPLKSLSKRPTDRDLKTTLKSLSKRPKTAADQELKSHSKPASKPPITTAAASDQDLKPKPAPKPSTIATTGDDQDLTTHSEPASKLRTTAVAQDPKTESKPASKPHTEDVDQGPRTQSKPASKPRTEAVDQELKTLSKPASKPRTDAADQDPKTDSKSSLKPRMEAADQDLKTQSKPASKPRTEAVDQAPRTQSKPASKPRVEAVNQDLKTRPKPASKPRTEAADQGPKTYFKPASKPRKEAADQDPKSDSTSASKPRMEAVDQDLKTESKPASKPAADQGPKTQSRPVSKPAMDRGSKTQSKPRPRTETTDQDSKTHTKPASKPHTEAMDQDPKTQLKPASKPRTETTDHDSKTQSKPKPRTEVADQDLKAQPKPGSKPPKTSLDDEPDNQMKPASEPPTPATTKTNESKSLEEGKTERSSKRPLPDGLIEMSIKKAKLAQQKSWNQKAAAVTTPSKQESHTYLILKFPRKSPLPSVSNLKVRFAQFKNMVVEGNRVMWNHHACRVQFRYRSEAVEAMNYVKGNRVFGQYEVECSLKAVEEPKEVVVVASGPKPILKKGNGGGGSDLGKESQRVQFVLPKEEPSICADLVMMRDPEGGEDEEFRRSFLGVLRKVADVVGRLRATPGFSLHHFVQN